MRENAKLSDSRQPAQNEEVIYHPHHIEVVGNILRQDILDACEKFESELATGSKEHLRTLHLEAKRHNATSKSETILSLFNKHRKHFRNGFEIDPTKIKPVLKFVERGLWADLFRIARSFWSLPYNKGYGRRLRFVVYDEYHEAVIGILGLQSPPADLSSRDNLFEYPKNRKLELVNSTMDAYTVGAIPPYSNLLAGKLCAGLISSDTIRRAYWRAYAGKMAEMSNQGVQQPLVAVTTTSAFGRSSMYNRVKFKDRLLAEPIGYTLGYGTLHLEHLYDRIREYLLMCGKFKQGGFGNGPKVRWQNITNTLTNLQISSELLRHGVKREVFLFRLVNNLEEGMTGGSFGAPIAMEELEFAQYWKERWALPRAQRFPSWNSGDSVDLLRQKLIDS
ncbi:MAG: Druantia anti-phage system protein DruA [Pseudomonadota bacterium]